MPSVLPPGAKGTMILTGFCGQTCDYAGWPKLNAASAVSNARSAFGVCMTATPLRGQPSGVQV
jgi:hypothetical protein